MQDPLPSKPHTKHRAPNAAYSGISQVPNLEHQQKAAPEGNLLNGTVNGCTKELCELEMAGRQPVL